ncbi:MAG: hypothetical protein LBU06_08890 [Desulfovibrio sp.]|jgi:hypothetical protein|nr:hypothetical protein [Desulfovibrio sp.]
MPSLLRKLWTTSFSPADLFNRLGALWRALGNTPPGREFRGFFSDLYAFQARKGCPYCGGSRCIRLCQLLGNKEEKTPEWHKKHR